MTVTIDNKTYNSLLYRLPFQQSGPVKSQKLSLFLCLVKHVTITAGNDVRLIDRSHFCVFVTHWRFKVSFSSFVMTIQECLNKPLVASFISQIYR